jgi:hypothetical protein
MPAGQDGDHPPGQRTRGPGHHGRSRPGPALHLHPALPDDEPAVGAEPPDARRVGPGGRHQRPDAGRQKADVGATRDRPAKRTATANIRLAVPTATAKTEKPGLSGGQGRHSYLQPLFRGREHCRAERPRGTAQNDHRNWGTGTGLREPGNSYFGVVPADALASTDAIRHLELSLSGKLNREASPEKRGTPDEAQPAPSVHGPVEPGEHPCGNPAAPWARNRTSASC